MGVGSSKIKFKYSLIIRNTWDYIFNKNSSTFKNCERLSSRIAHPCSYQNYTKLWISTWAMFNNSNSNRLFLAIHYCGDASLAFSRVRHICRDVNYGWILRIIHANGARFFFVCLYLHIGRGLYYGSYIFIHTRIVGVIILFIVIATAFLGYVLP